MLIAGVGFEKSAPAMAPITPTMSAPISAPANAATSATHAVHGFQRGGCCGGLYSMPSGSSGATPNEGGGTEEGAVDIGVCVRGYEAARRLSVKEPVERGDDAHAVGVCRTVARHQ